MNADHKDTGARLIVLIAGLCAAALMAGVLWASGRALELTDEAYYLLSAIYPDQIKVYISAQHWTLPALWQLTGSLQGFRITGALILTGSAGLLAHGAVHALRTVADRPVTRLTALIAIFAACVFALLYAATIPPSPSYNLLAAASANAAGGVVLLAVQRRRLLTSLGLCALAGVVLAIGFVNKPSAGVCATLVVLAWIATLVTGPRKWLCLAVVPAAAAAMVGVMVAAQPAEPGVAESLRNGLELFRQVQTEPIGARLIRYVITLLDAIRQAAEEFAPALLLGFAALWFRRTWLAALSLLAYVVIVVDEKMYLGGATNFKWQMEPIYALMLLLLIAACVRQSAPGQRQWRALAVFTGLGVLPYAVAMGTGNSLSTQVIVSAGPWGALVALLAMPLVQDRATTLLRRGLLVILLGLVPVQVLTSFTRDPYHMVEPISKHTIPQDAGVLGKVMVDASTNQMIAEIDRAKAACDIPPGTPFVGLYNVLGLAFLLDAIPPVTPWLNNLSQISTIMQYWDPDASERIILALVLNPDTTHVPVPERFDPDKTDFLYCGATVFPQGPRRVEIWASVPRAQGWRPGTPPPPSQRTCQIRPADPQGLCAQSGQYGLR